MPKTKQTLYRALTRLWSTKQEKYIEAGEIFGLDLSDEEISRLLTRQAIELSEQDDKQVPNTEATWQEQQ